MNFKVRGKGLDESLKHFLMKRRILFWLLIAYFFSSNLSAQIKSQHLTQANQVTKIVEHESQDSFAAFMPIPPVQFFGATNICPGQTGNISITNFMDYVGFQWSTNANTPSISINAPGLYTVTVTDATGTTTTGSYSVTSNSIVNTVDVDVTPQTSCNPPNGGLGLSIDPPALYSYMWSNGASTANIAFLLADHYFVTITDVFGCTYTTNFNVPDNTNPPQLDIGVAPSTCEQADGNIDLQPLSPSANYTYEWSSGETTEDILQVYPGGYSVTVTDVTSDCTTTISASIGNTNFVPEVTGTGTANSGCITANGAVIIDVAPTVVNYTFLWSNGETSQNLMNVPEGIYTVTVTHGVVCTAIASFTVANVPAIADLDADISPSLCGLPNGSIDVTPTPDGPYLYNWSTGQNTEDISGLAPGQYTVTISSATSVCTGTESFVVPETPVNIVLSGFNQPSTNCVNPNGSIDLQVSPPGNYNFAWSNGAITEDIYDLQIGNYTVTVSLSGECPSEGSYNVEDNLQFTQVSEFINPALCGQANGSIDLLLYPLTGNTFHWSNGATSEDLMNITPGNYTVTVSAFSGCTTTVNYLVPDTDLALNLTANTTANTSCTSPNGGINLSVSPLGSYTYHWSNGATTEDLQNVASGTYSVTVSATGNCTYTKSFTVTNSSGAPSLALAETPSTCGLANGALDLTVTPAGSYTFNWSNGTSLEDPQNLLPGTYSVTTTSASGCSAVTSYTLTNSTIATSITAATLPNSSCITPNGSIDLSISQVGNYNIAWSNGLSSEDLQSLSPGIYTVTVTQGVNCTQTASYEIVDNSSAPVITPTLTPATCGLSNGDISLNISPTSGNTISWSNGSNLQTLQNLSPGNYTVTITASNGCSSSQSINVPDNPIVFSANAAILANSSCQSPNGAIDVTMDVPGSYAFQWSNGMATQDLQNLTSGAYTVTITLGLNCTITPDFTVSNDTPSPQITPTAVPSNCGQANGSISLSANPAIGNTFSWSNGQITQNIQDLLAGIYTVTTTAANGCSTVSTVDVPDVNSNFSLLAMPSPSSSCVSNNGQIILNISPAGNYSISWSNGSMMQNLQNVPAGNYTATITDASGCSDEVAATVDGPVLPQINVTGPDNACAGVGTSTIVADTGFSTYNWSNGLATSSINVTQTGNYSVTATDINGCTAEASHSFTIFPNPTPNINGPASTCGNGTVYSVPGNFAQINWSTGAATQSINVSQSGTYLVTVTDQHDCTGTDSQNLAIGNSLIPDILVTVSPCDGTAIVDAGAGYATYSWSNGQNGQTFSTSTADVYSVTVSDGGACTGTGTAQVSFPALPQVQITGTTVICSGTSTDFAVPNIYAQITWSNGEHTPTINTAQAGNYSVTVTDINGCTATAQTALTIVPPLNPGISSDPPNCEGESILDAGPGFSSYNWSNGKTTQSILVSATGTYTVTVSDAIGLGCTDSASEDVVFPAPPQAEILGAANVCQGDATILMTADTSYSQYLWSNGDTTAQITITEGGTYSVTVSNSFGCTSTDEWTVTQSPIATTNLQTFVCSEQDTGTFQTILTSQFGCDSIITTTAVLSLPIFTQINLSACAGESILYNGTALLAGSSQTFVFNAANGCDSTILVNVSAYPAVNFDLTAEKTCWNAAEGVIEVNVLSGTQPFDFIIDNGNAQQTQVFQQVMGGEHTVKVVDANDCELTADIVVPQTIPSELLVKDAIIPCETGTVSLMPTLTAEDPSQIDWTWSDGSTTPTLVVNKEGSYEVEINDGCEVISRTIDVAWDEDYYKTEFFYIPNSFSPNFDGINDIFMAYPGQDFELLSYEFRVFDRWGDAMFATDDIAKGWDGINRSYELQSSVFVWFVKAKVRVCGIREVDVFLKGDVTVMR